MFLNYCSFCSNKEDKNDTLSLSNKYSNIPIGEDRIFKLSKDEAFLDFTQSFYKTDIAELEKYKKDKKDNSIFEMKNQYICFFCGGESCKWENPNFRKNSAIQGLLSDLYFDCVYASQRPNTCLIKEYNLIKVFKEKGIKLIINCQINGEHPYCGPNGGLEEDCGFSYSPATFISEGIDVLCKGFIDLTPPSTLDFILETTRKMAYIVKYRKGKILVHCHAGNGRTGIVLVCFFIYYFNKSYNEAIKELRKLRQKGVEKVSQEIFCQKFEAYIKEIKNFFPNTRKKIDIFIKNQKILDYNFDKAFIPSIIVSYYLKDINLGNFDELYKKIIDIEFIPKIVFECLEKIIEIKIFNNIHLKELYLILNGMNKLNNDTLNKIKIIKNDLKLNKWDSFKSVEDISIINELLFIWMNECTYNCIEPLKIEKILNQFISMSFPQKKIQPISESNILIDLNPLDNDLLNNLNKLFDEITDKDNNNSEIINLMLFIIKNELSKLEYESIKYISVFLHIIYPTNKFNNDSADINTNNNNIAINEYKRFLYKFCLFLLGYNLDSVNLTPNDFLKSKELLHSKMLIFIFELFIFSYNNSEYKNIIDDNKNSILKNNDIFFKYKNKNDFASVQKFL